MTDQPQNGQTGRTGAGSEQTGDTPAALGPQVPPASWRPEDEPSGAAALASERPEVAVGAAFAGGLVLALILKRLAR